MSTFARMTIALFTLFTLLMPSIVWAQEHNHEHSEAETTTEDAPKSSYTVTYMTDQEMEHTINNQSSWYIPNNWFSYARGSVGSIFFSTAESPPVMLMGEFTLSYEFIEDVVEASLGVGAGTHLSFIEEMTAAPFAMKFFAETAFKDWFVASVNYQFLEYWIQRDENGEKIPGISLGELRLGFRYKTDGDDGFIIQLEGAGSYLAEHRDRFGFGVYLTTGGFFSY